MLFHFSVQARVLAVDWTAGSYQTVVAMNASVRLNVMVFPTANILSATNSGYTVASGVY